MKENQALIASRKRAAHPDFVPTFSLGALQAYLPFRFPVPGGVRPSPKRHYRSEYRYLGYADLGELAQLANLTLFEIGLRLIDFSPLRDYLAQAYYVGSARGQVPFDPVSLFLCVCLRRELKSGWRKLAKLLAGEHGAAWRRLFGFRQAETPSASGLRYFFNTVGPQVFEELCPLFIDLLHQVGWLPEHSTFPGDPPQRGISISHDIVLHEACSEMRCSQVADTCYQPALRPCPVREAGQEGCDCTRQVCARSCRWAPPLNREARSIHYAAGNKYADLPGQSKAKGRHVYGYASNPDRLLDDRFACACLPWRPGQGTLRIGLHPANADERSLFPLSFAQLRWRFPYLKIGEVLADAALGFQVCLDPIWEAGTLRMVDIRAAEGDDDRQVQPRRGYNQNGHPLCLHGYPMHPNGHDYQRRRTKWHCRQVCLEIQTDLPGTQPSRPAPDCPYQAPRHKHGQVVNVGCTSPDGSLRLAREVPYGSQTWKKCYGRCNLSESRNGSLENLGLKRLPSFGLTRGRKEVAIADFLVNLFTLARLVLEASTLALKATNA